MHDQSPMRPRHSLPTPNGLRLSTSFHQGDPSPISSMFRRLSTVSMSCPMTRRESTVTLGSPLDGSPPFLGFTGFSDDLFCCLLCLDSFRSPRLLECQHVFCEPCLQVFYRTYQGEKYEQTGVFVPCPTCRELTKMPPNGLAELDLDQNAEKLEKLSRKMSTIQMGTLQQCDICIYKNRYEETEFYCSKCALNLCSGCKQVHTDQHLFKSHQVIHISNKETINLYCEKHNKLPMVYFCQDCGMPACAICIHQEHQPHRTVKLRDALQLRRDNIKTELNTLGPKMDQCEAKLKKLSYINAISQTRNGVHRSSSVTNTTIMEDVVYHDKRKMSMFEKQDSSTTTAFDIRNYHSQLDQVRKLYVYAAKIVEMSQSKKLLAVSEEIVNRLSAAAAVEVENIVTQVDKRLDERKNTFNEIMHQMSCGSNGSTLGYTEHSGSVSSTEGSSSLDDAVFDKPKQSLLIRPKLLWKVEKQKHDTGDLWNPCDVNFLPGNNVVVAEYDIMNDRNNRLRIFDEIGKTKLVIGRGEIRPLGVTLTQDNNIAVTDCKAKRVKVFAQTGELISEWGKGQFGWPYGIDITSRGQFVISDAFNDTISIHQPDGKRIKQFGTSGSNNSQFRNPYHIAIDRQDNIIVSDCGNHCFKVFDINGQFLFRSAEIKRNSNEMFVFESKRKRRKLRAPRGISIDIRGNILIADDNYRVCMFDPQGKYLRNILTEEDSVKFAEGLSTNTSGLLAVTEWNPHNMFAVKIFSLYE